MGDDGVPCLVASSVYDTKPVHYLSMISCRIEWLEVKKKVWNVDTCEYEEIKFLRLNFINNYNFTMGHVDVADQLRGNYRMDRWVRNRNWWWTMMFWGIGTLLTNSYVVYLKINLRLGVDKKDLLSHYDFRKDIALYWINPDLYMEDNKQLAQASEEFSISRKKRNPIVLSSSQSSISNLSSPPTSIVKRSAALTDGSLKLTGILKCRLDRSIDHLPIPAKNKSLCPFHQWAAEIRNESGNRGYCQACNVTLCMECYRLFHMEPDLVKKKEEIKKGLISKNTDNSQKSKKRKKK